MSARYSYSHWLSVGGTYSSMDTRDNEKYLEGGSLQESLKYKLRIPNQPYRYASLDASLYWHDLFAKEIACRSRMTAIISTNFR